MEEVYSEYFHANGNDPFVFESLRRLETEALAMTADLLHGDENTRGSLTSCGSESLLMAVKPTA
jgi:glutamate/tyrosine decarboxylase-like PLP-dependent enzyme